MKIKTFLILVYASSSLLIASFTAVMTYIIIDEPIGFRMFSKISMSVLLTLPMIGIVSLLIGKYFAKKFVILQERLNHITIHNAADTYTGPNTIEEINTIHTTIDFLALRLEETIASLHERNSALSNMMISFSHDVKTPLTIINGYLEELEDGLIKSEDLPPLFAILKKETNFINEMSLDIITYIQSLKNSRDKESIHLELLLKQELLPLLKPQKEVHIEVDLRENFSIYFNLMDIKKTLFNLLHNSTKFTHEGSIKIYNEGEDILIEDTGIGIPLAFHESIFQAFATVDASKNRKESGFGLGLSIAHNLARNNGYILELNRHFNKGSQFILHPMSAL